MTVHPSIHFVIALFELSLAMALFHRALPASIRNIGRGQGVMVWLLAMALAMFGVGRFITFMYGGNGHWVYTVGHVCMICLGVLAYKRAMRFGPANWWELGEDNRGKFIHKPHI